MLARVPSRLLPSIALLALLGSCGRPTAPAAPRVTYRLSVTDPALGIDVTIRVAGARAVALETPAPVERMRLDGVEFVDAAGARLAPERSAQTSFARDDELREIALTSESYSLDPA